MASSAKKSAKLSGPEQAAQFMNDLEHPLKREIEAVRNVILNADPWLTEHIKWNAPSFCIRNEDRITFHLQGKGFFRLIFHCGAKVRENAGAGRIITDTTGLLEWAANDRAIVKFYDMDDVEAKKEKLVDVIKKWIEANS